MTGSLSAPCHPAVEVPAARITAAFAEAIAIPDRCPGATGRKLAALAFDPTIRLPRLSGSSEVNQGIAVLPIEWKDQGPLALWPGLANRSTSGRRAPQYLPVEIDDPIPAFQLS